MAPIGAPLTAADRALVRAAQAALRRGYDATRHTVAAAVRTRAGRTFVGLNLNGLFTPCAEPVALGTAITAGDPEVVSMVAVHRRGARFPVLSPCGTCRQMLYDYAPRATALVAFPGGSVRRLTAAECLPGAYATFG
ncbi:MAG TPA: cytidine deaminase [Thermoplasmata archaeon]|nr:cytidine deaminase [Thermoplasmata archaeon]